MIRDRVIEPTAAIIAEVLAVLQEHLSRHCLSLDIDFNIPLPDMSLIQQAAPEEIRIETTFNVNEQEAQYLALMHLEEQAKHFLTKPSQLTLEVKVISP